MTSVEQLQFTNKRLKQTITAEWLRQAYLRKQHEVELSSLLNRIHKLEDIVMDASHAQDGMLKEVMYMNQISSEVTPRFYSPELHSISEEPDDELYGDSARECVESINVVTQGVHKLAEAQKMIVSQYKTFTERSGAIEVLAEENERLREEINNLQTSYIEGESFLELKSMYSQESSKVCKLTNTLQKLQGEFTDLQDVVDDLRNERESLQYQLAERQDDSMHVTDLKEQLSRMPVRHSDGCDNCQRNYEKLQKLQRDLSELSADLDYTEDQLKNSIKERKQLEFELSHRTPMTTPEKEKRRSEASSRQESPRNDTYVRLGNLENEKQDLVEQLNALTQKNVQLEKANRNLLDQVDMGQNEQISFKQILQEYEEENSSKEHALEKAQNLIKKLNDECERTVKDLKKYEAEVVTLKKENRQYEKAWLDAKKQMNDVDIFKQTEARLRAEVLKLKEDLAEVSKLKDEENDELAQLNEQVYEEKLHLEKSLGLLEGKLVEIQDSYQSQIMKQQDQETRLNQLEEVLTEKDEVIARMICDNESREEEREAEVTHLKRQAENALRNLQNFQVEDEGPPKPYTQYANLNKRQQSQPQSRSPSKSPLRRGSPLKKTNRTRTPTTRTPTKPGAGNKENFEKVEVTEPLPVVSPATIANMQVLLGESMSREEALKAAIARITNEAADYLKENLETISRIEGQARPELERWLMRNEDLESHLIKNQEKSLRLQTSIKDFTKMIQIKNRQMEDISYQKNSLKIELESLIDFLRIELQDKNSFIQKEILPHSQNILSSSLSTSHEKLNAFKTEIDMLRNQISEASESLQAERQNGNSLTEAKKSLEGDLVKCMNDLRALQEFMYPGVDQSQFQLYSPIAKDVMERLENLKQKEVELEEIWQSNTLMKHNNEHLKQELDELIEKYKKDLAEKESKYRDEIFNLKNSNSADQQDLKKRLIDVDQDWNAKYAAMAAEVESQNRKLQAYKEIAHNDSESRATLQTKIEIELEETRNELDNLMDDNNRLQSQNVMLGEKIEELEQVMIDERKQFSSEVDKKTTYVKSLENELDQFAKGKYQDDTAMANDVQLLQDQLATASRNNEILLANEAKLNYEMQGSQTKIRDLKLALNRKDKSQHGRTRSQHSRSHIDEGEDRITSRRMDHLMNQKDETIRDLEIKLEDLQRSKNNLLQMSQSCVDTSRYGFDDLERKITKLERKKLSDKKSFQKRVKEFELILRYLEEKIKIATGEQDGHIENHMQEMINELTTKNQTLDSWLNVLCHRLDNFSHEYYVTKLRERQTYQELCSFLIEQADLPADIADYKTLFNTICDNIDFDNTAKKLVDKTKILFRNMNLVSPKSRENYTGISGVTLSITHADLLAMCQTRSFELERALVTRSDFMTQMTGKVGEISSRVENHPERMVKLLNAIQQCIWDLNADIRTDMYAATELAKTLGEIWASSSEIEANRAITMGSYYRKSSRASASAPLRKSNSTTAQIDTLLSSL